jgi:hypothetical protein
MLYARSAAFVPYPIDSAPAAPVSAVSAAGKREEGFQQPISRGTGSRLTSTASPYSGRVQVRLSMVMAGLSWVEPNLARPVCRRQ